MDSTPGGRVTHGTPERPGGPLEVRSQKSEVKTQKAEGAGIKDEG